MSWKLLPKFRQITWFCYLCFYGRQADKPARPIGWLGSCERKYCLRCREKALWKNFEPFWRNTTSKIVLSWKLLPKFRQITWFCYLCFYGRQADKPERPIGWLGSCETKCCLLGTGKILCKNFEPFWRNVTSKIVFSCMFCLYIAMNDSLLLPMFPWTPIVQTSAANWLTRFKWKEILFTWRRENIMKKFRAVLEKCNI